MYVGIVTFNRPEAMNALNEQVEKEGMRAFAEKRKPNYTKY